MLEEIAEKIESVEFDSAKIFLFYEKLKSMDEHNLLGERNWYLSKVFYLIDNLGLLIGDIELFEFGSLQSEINAEKVRDPSISHFFSYYHDDSLPEYHGFDNLFNIDMLLFLAQEQAVKKREI